MKAACTASAALFAAWSLCLAVRTAVMAQEKPTVLAARMHSRIGGAASDELPGPVNNFVFSPLSILTVFNAAQRGARGETREEMDSFASAKINLALPTLKNKASGDKNDAVIVDIFSHMYVHSSFTSRPEFASFQKELQSSQGSKVTPADFSNQSATAKRINDDVSLATRGHIKSLIEPSTISEITRIVLINALYFKSPWFAQPRAKPTPGTFYSLAAIGADGTLEYAKTEALYVRHKSSRAPLSYYKSDSVTGMGIPYSDPRLRLYVFVPHDIVSFEAKLAESPNYMDQLIGKMTDAAVAGGVAGLDFLLPKFKLSAESQRVNLAPVFRSLGMNKMFDPNYADFSGITGRQELFVSSFVHQADALVDENGTEAAAATAVIMTMRSLPPPDPPTVIIDKPFVFQIRFADGNGSNTELVLFSGRITDIAKACH